MRILPNKRGEIRDSKARAYQGEDVASVRLPIVKAEILSDRDQRKAIGAHVPSPGCCDRSPMPFVMLRICL